jgi:hypothetical protein
MRSAGENYLIQTGSTNMLTSGGLHHAATADTPAWKNDIKDSAARGTGAVFDFSQKRHGAFTISAANAEH